MKNYRTTEESLGPGAIRAFRSMAEVESALPRTASTRIATRKKFGWTHTLRYWAWAILHFEERRK